MVIGFQNNNLTRIRTTFEEHNKKSQNSQVKDVKEMIKKKWPREFKSTVEGLAQA